MSEQTPISIATFLFAKLPLVLESSLELNPVLGVRYLQDLRSAQNSLEPGNAILLLVSVETKEDLIQLSQLVKEAKKLSNLAYKFVVFTQPDHQFEKAFAKLGLMDFISPNITTKSLRYKLDFWIRSLKIQQKSLDQIEKSKTKSSQEAQAAGASKSLQKVLTWLEPMRTSDDTWLLKSETDCRYIMSRWLVQLMGPSPYVGRWQETEEKGCWEFKFKSESNSFTSKEGRWFFRGTQKPEFIWKENLWLIASEAYDLFYTDGRTKESRIVLRSQHLQICRNSAAAKAKEESLIESFDSELICAVEEQDDSKKSFDLDSKKPKYLKGKGKTENLGDSFLTSDLEKQDRLDGPGESGGTKDPSVTSATGALKGTLKPSEAAPSGPLTGKLTPTGELASDRLKGKLKPSEDGSTDPLSGKVKSQGVAPQAALSGQVKDAEESASSNLSGRLKGAKITPESAAEATKKASKETAKTPMSGVVKEQVPEAGVLFGRVKQADAPLGIPLSGKADTSQLGSFLSANGFELYDDNFNEGLTTAELPEVASVDPLRKTNPSDHLSSYYSGASKKPVKAPGEKPVDVSEAGTSSKGVRESEKAQQLRKAELETKKTPIASEVLEGHLKNETRGGAPVLDDLGGQSNTEKISTYYGVKTDKEEVRTTDFGIKIAKDLSGPEKDLQQKERKTSPIGALRLVEDEPGLASVSLNETLSLDGSGLQTALAKDLPDLSSIEAKRNLKTLYDRASKQYRRG